MLDMRSIRNSKNPWKKLSKKNTNIQNKKVDLKSTMGGD